MIDTIESVQKKAIQEVFMPRSLRGKINVKVKKGKIIIYANRTNKASRSLHQIL